ncbi:HAD hydrolase-like protein [Flavobacteriaceae bacterium MHTCC 0001]
MKFIIFDIDGTLANTTVVDENCFIAAFEDSFGIDISTQNWADFKHVTDWGITEEIIERQWNRKPTPEEYLSLKSNFIQHLKGEKERDVNQFNEVFGAKDFFTMLQNMEGVKLGIATGGWGISAKFKLEHIGIDLKGISFSNSDYYKSREMITLNTINQLARITDEPLEQIIYFGDGEWDFKTCNNLGIEFIGIDVQNNGKLKKLGAKTVFNDYSKSEEIIKAII